MNLSFAGCGFLGIYHVGVAVCFRQYAPHLLLEKISGASAGAIAACCLLCELPLGDITSDVLRVASEARTSILGPFSPSFDIQKALLEGLEKFLPADAHIRVSGKLHISLTRVCDGKNVIISQFESREDLLQALLSSAFIPLFSGLIPPKFRGVRYVDGGLSDNLPTLDENTITVSPFCGESDICPRDDSHQLFHINVANTSIELSKQNIYRFARIMFPPKPEVLSNMCKQGFDDALRFLHRNNLINCTKCLSVQSTFTVSETLDESFEYDPECEECKVHRQEALVSNMPDTVLTIFQEAIESANKGIINWVFKHSGMKILSVLSLPYTVPADIVCATYSKLNSSRRALFTKLTSTNLTNIIGNHIETRSFTFQSMGKMTLVHSTMDNIDFNNDERLHSMAPKMSTNIWDVSRYLLDQLSSMLKRKYSNDRHNSKLNCKLAITEYNGGNCNLEIGKETTQNHVNLNFTVNLEESEIQITKKSGKKCPTHKVFSKRPSLAALNHVEGIGDDTFETILQVTSHHEAVMAYYYTDENNKINWTEIYDMTDADCELLQSEAEKENNKQLQFDEDWDAPTWYRQQRNNNSECFDDDAHSLAGISDITIEEINERRDSVLICSDPESEWNGSVTVNIPDEMLTSSPDLRPESDQPPQSSLYKIASNVSNV